MKIKGLLYLLIIPTIVIGLSSWYSSGSPGGKTGSPGDGSNCTECHTGTPQSASSWITTNIPASGYTPGETYTITASGTHSGVNKFGFETTAEALGGAKKGTFIITDAAQTKFTNSNKAVTHTSGGTTPSGNSKSWTFDWTAPAAGTGNVTFFGAFNAANGNGNTGGDVIYLSSTTVSEEEMEPETSLTIAFTGMTPHIGKLLEIRLVNKYNMMEFARKAVDPIASANFDVVFENIVDGDSYFVDFYADHNDNGMYDAPPADHAWRLDADNVQGGDVIPFAHNTNFTDIDWKHLLTINFEGMSPHIGKLLEISLRDITMSYEETYRTSIASISSASFAVEMPALTPGHTYNIDFYADHNGNGTYDAPPMDHAWRMKSTMVEGDADLSFAHNTDFTDIGWTYHLTLDLMGMVPHQGQMLMVRATNTVSGKEVNRIKRGVDLVDISLSLPGLEMGETYNIDS